MSLPLPDVRPTRPVEPVSAAAVRLALEDHWLSHIECDHARHRDNPHCACSLVFLGWHPTVGDAVQAWINHVFKMAEGYSA